MILLFTNVIAMEFEAEPDKPYPIEQDYWWNYKCNV